MLENRTVLTGTLVLRTGFKWETGTYTLLAGKKVGKTHHGRDSEVSGMHLLGEPINLSSSVDEDHSLGDGEGFIQVTECVQLPFLGVRGGRKSVRGYTQQLTTRPASCTGPHLSFHIDVELADTLQGQLFLLDKNSNRIPHELLGHLKHIRRHCS